MIKCFHSKIGRFICQTVLAVGCGSHIAAQTPTAAELVREATVFGAYDSFATIPGIVSRAQGSSNAIKIVKSIPEESHVGHEPGKDAELAELINNSAGVIVGHYSSKASYLTASKAFIFTRYVVVVDKIIKAPTPGMRVGDRIVIARAGGILRVDGRTVIARDPDAVEIQPNEPAVFGLHAIPGASGYFTDPDSVFALGRNSVAAGRRSRVDANDSPDHFIQRLEESSARSGRKN